MVWMERIGGRAASGCPGAAPTPPEAGGVHNASAPPPKHPGALYCARLFLKHLSAVGVAGCMEGIGSAMADG